MVFRPDRRLGEHRHGYRHGMRVIVLPDADTHAEAVCGLVLDTIEGVSGRVDIGLAGGSTPVAAYRRLAEASVDWDRVILWLSDERWVPWDHPESNGGMALDALGDRPRLLRPRHSDRLMPSESAYYYEAELRRSLPEPRSHLVMLGMGADGHTASLFPETAALSEDERWYTANWVPKLDAWRLTATYPLLVHARRLVVMATGESKADTVATILEGETNLPATRLRDTEGDLAWVLDEAAASRLTTTSIERPLGP